MSINCTTVPLYIASTIYLTLIRYLCFFVVKLEFGQLKIEYTGINTNIHAASWLVFRLAASFIYRPGEALT